MQISGYISIAAIAFVVIYFLSKIRSIMGIISQKNKKPAKPGTVILHQFPPASELSVNGSPPCLKLETFLRMTKIPYENDYGLKFSKKGKKPWIEFNGQEIADSNFCIQFLKKEFQVDTDSHLSATEKAIAHSVSYHAGREHVLGPCVLHLSYRLCQGRAREVFRSSCVATQISDILHGKEEDKG
ncbi:hypothetical protein OS493_036389 [Desmophyllum pertusum]|uniref:Thioredoxin-like fold domain-containing protein n=1 Tax=Desmophyllum pertusum TaxID=174260 RepID=A0A9W9ZX83_9CNID|nr:hypothetical protein OS493_036389 [Desmophyllum pertusum]